MSRDDDEFWAKIGEALQPRPGQTYWAEQRRRIVSGLPPEDTAGQGGWWKVPALTLVSCAVYVLCVETALLPPRGPEAPAASFSAGTVSLSTALSDDQEAGWGRLLTLVEGVER